MADPVAAVEKTVEAPISFAKRNPVAFALLVVVLILLVLHFSVRMQTWMATRAAGKTSGVWYRVAKFTGAVAVIAIFLAAAPALAATASQHGAALLDFGKFVAVSGMAAAVAFPASDFCALKDETGNFTSIIDPGSAAKERRFYFEAQRETFGGFPIKATDIQFALSLELANQGSTATPVAWDEIASFCFGLDIYSPRFQMMAVKESLTGPVLKHMAEFITRGYAYSGDEMFAVLDPATAPYAITYYFNYPLMQRYLAKPDESAWFVGWLQKTRLSFWLNSIGAIAEAGGSPGAAIAAESVVSLRAGYRYIIGAVQGDIRDAYQVPAVPYHEVLKTPAQGQNDIPFYGIGGAGPSNTDISAGARLVAAVLLSDRLGLPGAGPVNDITELGCEALGILPTESVDMFLMAKLPKRDFRAPYGSSTLAGWPWKVLTADQPRGPMDENTLLGMPLVLPSIGQKVTKLMRIKGDLTVHARRPTPPAGSGLQHALYVCTLRDVRPDYAATMLRDAGVTGTTTRAVNHNANAKVASGQASPANYVGTPIVAK